MVDQMSSLMALRTTLKSANLLGNTYGDIDGLEVTGITQDSRSVKKGDLFVAWKGSESVSYTHLTLPTILLV